MPVIKNGGRKNQGDCYVPLVYPKIIGKSPKKILIYALLALLVVSLVLDLIRTMCHLLEMSEVFNDLSLVS